MLFSLPKIQDRLAVVTDVYDVFIPLHLVLICRIVPDVVTDRESWVVKETWNPVPGSL